MEGVLSGFGLEVFLFVGIGVFLIFFFVGFGTLMDYKEE